MEEDLKDDQISKEYLSACQPFLVDKEMERGRHKAMNIQMYKLETKTINENEVFNKLDSAAKINIALGFALRKF